MSRTGMKKFIGSIKRSSAARSRSKDKDSRNGVFEPHPPPPEGDHPEAVVVREVMAFCEAGAPGSNSAGDEYLHLPAIVDAAESSPAAAREALLCLQRYLSKQNFERGYAQYNAIMLLRILTDNPGHVFTQNFDKSFVSTVKTLLRECRDSSVQQITRETLDYMEAEKLNGNDTLMPLIEMWRKEKGGSARMYGSSGRSHSGAAPSLQRTARPPRGLPPAQELAARIEESRTSARLLVQMVQSTPQEELIGNELIKEFSERARQAHKSIQEFINCENPAPDEETMLTLIETSEQLGIAMNKHQRAMLQARRAAGHASANTTPQPQANPQDPFSTVAMQNALPSSQSHGNQYGDSLPVPTNAAYSNSQPQRNAYDPYPSANPSHAPEPVQNSSMAASEPPRPHHQREASDLYGPSSPQRSYPDYSAYTHSEGQDLYGSTGRVSPIERDEQPYRAPPGPPPPRIKQPQTYNNEPVEVPAPEPNRYGAQQAPPLAPTATRDYDVSENPFADENAYSSNAQAQPIQQQPHYQAYSGPAEGSGPPQQEQYQAYSGSAPPPPAPRNNPHSLFNRAAGQLRDPQSPTRSNNQSTPVELDSSSYPVPPPHRDTGSPTRPGTGPRGYHENWQPTPSFVKRQDSSTAHITMSGASPPPDSRS